MQDTETSKRAYHLWIEGGCHEGQSDHHWLAAQREVLLSTSLGELGRIATSDPAKSPKSKKAKTGKQRRAA
jgi:hypothetical protein